MKALIIALLFAAAAFAKPVARQDIECEACEFLLTAVEHWLASNATETQIIAQLDKLCQLFPKYDAQCEEYMKNIPVIIAALEQYETPEVACKQLGECKNVEVTAPIDCQLCKEVFSKLEAWLKDNKTETEIETQLDKLCDLLGHPKVCETIVKYTVPDLIDLFETYETPEKICHYLDHCNTTVAPEPSSVECEACEYVIKLVEQWVASGSTEAEIEKLLEQVCKFLPNSYQKTCDTVIETGIPEIIRLLEEYETPAAVCAQLALCSAKVKLQANPLECEACKYVIGLVENWLAENKTVAEIEKLIEGICKFLPNNYQKPCDTVVETGIPEIIALLEAYETPAAVCSQIDLCSAKTAHAKLIAHKLIAKLLKH